MTRAITAILRRKKALTASLAGLSSLSASITFISASSLLPPKNILLSQRPMVLKKPPEEEVLLSVFLFLAIAVSPFPYLLTRMRGSMKP